MGIGIGGRSRSGTSSVAPWMSRATDSEESFKIKKVEPAKVPGNPDPDNYKIIRAKEIGSTLVVEIQYLDCTNYEGRKILVFENLSLINLVNQKSIDPHFFPSGGKFKSPVARFEPTERGWKWAISFVSKSLIP